MKWYTHLWAFIKKKCWYIFLLVASSIYVWVYRNEICQLREFNAQNLVFILWFMLLIMPLFSEMEFFGVKFKREIEKARGEVKECLSDIRMQIMELKISNSIANNIQITALQPLPSEKEIKEKKRQVLEARSKTEKILSVSDSIDFGVSEQSVFLFQARLSIEKKLSELCDKTYYDGNKSIFQMLYHLSIHELIDNRTVDLINQVVKITNRGVHGEIVSDKYLDFVKTVLPEVQEQLDDVSSKLHYCVCPRCKYSGYSMSSNVCPKCGFVDDND